MMNYKQKLLIAISASIFIISCGEKIPVKEMSLAKMEISRAMSVMAKKYAPQEINEAEKKLIESHEFVKQDALDKSKDSAIASRKKAQEAYEKSIPLLAKDTLEIAKQSLEQAEVLYAEVLAENEYKQAKGAFTEASGLYDQKSYYPCYEKSVEADGLAKEARNVAMGKKEILSKSIAEVKTILAEAEKYNASTIAKEKIQTANENLVIADESYKNLELKKGFKAVEVAGTSADEAYLMAIKEMAKGKIEGADKLYSEAQNSEGAAGAKDELNGAKEALNQSKSLFQDSKYKESMLSSDESARLSNLVLGSFNRSAKEKIASAEGMYTQAKNSAGAAIAVSQLNEAGNSLDLSKSLYKESKYKESIAAATESERLSKIVINTKTKGEDVAAGSAGGKVSSGKDSSSIFSDEYFIYKVRYIPERRDCLWRIAEKYYSNPFYWQYIYKANTDKIYNPNLIWPNMLLKVPKVKKAGAQEEKKEAVTETIKESAPVQEKEIIAPAQEEKKEAVPETIKESAPVPDKEKEVVAPVTEEKKEAKPEKAIEPAIVPEKEKEVIAPVTEEMKEAEPERAVEPAATETNTKEADK